MMLSSSNHTSDKGNIVKEIQLAIFKAEIAGKGQLHLQKFNNVFEDGSC